jgi:hypothetical protein
MYMSAMKKSARLLYMSQPATKRNSWRVAES